MLRTQQRRLALICSLRLCAFVCVCVGFLLLLHGAQNLLWNTVELGWLRARLHDALVPSPALRAHLDVVLGHIGRVAKQRAVDLPASQAGGAAKTGGQDGSNTWGESLPYVALHLRHEADWSRYCVSEAANTATSQVSSFGQCFKSAAEVAAILQERGFAKTVSPLLYVAAKRDC